MSLDPTAVKLLDTPPEWKVIPPEIFDRLKPKDGIYTIEQRNHLDAITSARWFLVRNEVGARCRTCRVGRLPGAIHPYVSMGCLPVPFNGLDEMVFLLREQQGSDTLFSAMRPGTIVPIDRRLALELNRRIREKRYPTLARERILEWRV